MRPPFPVRLSRAMLAAFAGLTVAHAVPLEISGIRPDLAFFNDAATQSETGVGAMAPYAGKLWVVTYSGHNPNGGGDGIFEISPDLSMTRRPESVGGTPANRFVERTTGKLFIGPYVIDPKGALTAFSYKDMPGRYTATCADPFKPGSVLTYTMEEGTYRIDATTLAHEKLFSDGNAPGRYVIAEHMLPGYHGKGAWSSQGVYVVANNGQYPYTKDGPTGCLAEWDGTPGKNTQDVTPWRVIRRNQFTEVTGPGGVYGAVSPDSPVWSLGWDKRSVILACRDGGEWSFRRLPKGGFTYNAEHGWYTEWPRIRDVEGDPADGKGRHLMTMHGQLWDFDPSYRAGHAVAPRPLTGYLRIIGDFARWDDKVGGDRIVFGTDDISKFDNALCTRSESNLWFVDPAKVDSMGGPALGWGAVWLRDNVVAGMPSDAMDVSGYTSRTLSLSSDNKEPVFFTVQHDADGSGVWKTLRVVRVAPAGFQQVALDDLAGGWVRVIPSADAPGVSAVFQMKQTDRRTAEPDAALFGGLAKLGESAQSGYGFIQAMPGRGLNVRLGDKSVALDATPAGFVASAGLDAESFTKIAVPKGLEKITVTAGAVLVKERKHTWRLPKHSALHDTAQPAGWARTLREIATERSMLSAAGTFFEFPRDISGGVTGARPVASHDFAVTDFVSWRGILLMTGVKTGAKADGKHLFDAGDAGQVWAGGIDDLWHLGKPRGTVLDFEGADVPANTPGDACLMHGYDKKTLIVSHAGAEPLKLALELDVEGAGENFRRERTVTVEPGKTVEIKLDGLMARWARLVPLADAKALKAGFRYE